MKKQPTIKYSHGIAAAGATALATALNGHAQAPDSFFDHFYIGAGGGVALAQSISIEDNNPFAVHTSNAIKFDTGWRADGYVGYSFCRYFSAQLDSGIVWNDLSTLGGESLSGIASAHLEQVPVLAEGLFSYPLGRFKPYLLAGAGADFGIFHGSNFQNLGGPSSYNSTDTTFAYEAGVGCTYALTRHLEIGADYKFLGTTDHSWTSGGFNLKTGGTMEHTIEAKLIWRF